MALNRKCPKCGSEKVQLSNEESKNGCLWLILFGWIYLAWIAFKWMVGFTILVCIDSWMFILASSKEKGYVWKSKSWFSGRRKIYFCHDCGYNFRG